jgi:hypothetical protein
MSTFVLNSPVKNPYISTGDSKERTLTPLFPLETLSFRKNSLIFLYNLYDDRIIIFIFVSRRNKGGYE